jgi:hypothetical protein
MTLRARRSLALFNPNEHSWRPTPLKKQGFAKQAARSRRYFTVTVIFFDTTAGL